ncbi:MAG TPA: hypothetical protein P5234_16450 [Thermoanaerobaculaceae bacterium]|nr:hypothetical protein [Thermoanaerobaculaceae bacterium]HRS17830.1 hypothetical protein [Thermoanaerobaculaceae bacterium]
MRNLMLYIVDDPKTDIERVCKNLRLQVDNSLELGWDAEAIWLYASFPFEHRGVSARQVRPPARPATARATSFYKTWCILQALRELPADECVWYHDVEAYQLVPIPLPPTTRAMAFCLYTARDRMLVQGGSMFFSGAARAVFERVMDRLVHDRVRKDEYALTEMVGRPEFLGWFEVLDYSWNLGDTDFELRYQLAARPIKAVHFHLDRRDHAAKFLDGKNGLGVRPLPERFVRLLARHGFAAKDGSEGADLPRERRSWLEQLFSPRPAA